MNVDPILLSFLPLGVIVIFLPLLIFLSEVTIIEIDDSVHAAVCYQPPSDYDVVDLAKVDAEIARLSSLLGPTFPTALQNWKDFVFRLDSDRFGGTHVRNQSTSFLTLRSGEYEQAVSRDESRALMLYEVLKYAEANQEFFIKKGHLNDFVSIFSVDGRVTIDVLLLAISAITPGREQSIADMLNSSRSDGAGSGSAASVALAPFSVKKFADLAMGILGRQAGGGLHPNLEVFLEVFFGDTVKKVYTTPSENAEVKTIEEKMQAMGISAFFADDLQLAGICSLVFSAVQKYEKINLPKMIIAVDMYEESQTKGMVPFLWEPFLAEGVFDPKCAENATILFSRHGVVAKEGTDAAAQFSFHLRLHTAVHELFHVFQPQVINPREGKAIFEQYAAPGNEMGAKIKKEISPYALSEKTGAEFFAEAGAKLVMEGKLSPEMMEIFNKFGGDKLTELIPVLQKAVKNIQKEEHNRKLREEIDAKQKELVRSQ